MRLNTNKLHQSVRLALAVGAASTMVAAPAMAQDDAEQLETITVVGSRIKRVDIETSQPVFVVEKEDLQRSGLANVGDVLTNLVYADNGTVTTVTNNTNGGDGTINISLRNLGPDRTLVLVNGRRWVGDLDNVVDLQTIPLAIVERIEVLKDGASAIYGSDAIAGVVNVVTRDSYDGAEANAYLGENSEGDGRVESYDFTLGTSTDRASLVANVAYTKQEPIFAADREISAEPQFGGGLAFGSASPARGRFIVGAPPFGTTNRTLIPGRPGTSPDDFRPYNGAVDAYNFAPVNFLQQKYDRWSSYVQGRYNITDNVTFFTQVAYVKRRGMQQLAEVPLTLSATGSQGPQWDFGTVSVAQNNIFNPFGQGPNGVGVRDAFFRMRALGPRQNFFDYDTWAFTGGFEGAFDLADRTWSWDIAYQYQDSDYDQTGRNYVNLFNLRNALGPSFRDAAGNLRCGTPTAIIIGCTPFNLFGGEDLGVAAGVITPEEQRRMLDYVGYTLVNTQSVEVTNYTANITGDLFELPAGPFSIAAGYEYRNTDGVFQPDSLVAEGGSSTNFTEPTSGTQTVDEFYVELNIPVVKDLPGLQLLEFNVAGRYSDYTGSGRVGLNQITNEIGETENFKIGFRWKPIEDLLVRGNFAETFRAPSVSDLFAGGVESFPAITDPCRNALGGNAGNNIFGSLTPDAQQRCLDQGVPAGGYNQPNSQYRTLGGGNPTLKPEFGDTVTLGLVYSPSYVEGLDIYLDWYKIELEDAQAFFGGNTILNRCINQGQLGFCDFITRVAGGEIANIRVTSFNAAETVIEGYDLGVNYRFDTEWGKFSVAWNSTYTTDNYALVLNPDGSAPPVNNDVGELIGDFANYRIRSTLGLNWSLGDFDATWNVRFLGRLEEDCTGFEDAVAGGFGRFEFCDYSVLDGSGDILFSVNEIPSTTYHDLQVGWNTPWNGRIVGGLRNAFDKDPPVTVNTFANSFPQGYDIPGRFWYVQYNQKF